MESQGGWAGRIPHARSAPMYAIHAVALIGPFLVRFSWGYVWLAVGLYLARMLALSGGYHRYFAHRSFKTGRAFQFVLAFLGGTCAQRGALWWAANHRDHHRNSDGPEDVQRPVAGLVDDRVEHRSDAEDLTLAVEHRRGVDGGRHVVGRLCNVAGEPGVGLDVADGDRLAGHGGPARDAAADRDGHPDDLVGPGAVGGDELQRRAVVVHEGDGAGGRAEQGTGGLHAATEGDVDVGSVGHAGTVPTTVGRRGSRTSQQGWLVD